MQRTRRLTSVDQSIHADMYCVYWLEEQIIDNTMIVSAWKELTDELLVPIETTQRSRYRRFGSKELTEALHFCEELRTDRRAGEPISFITMASEDPNAVGEQGVSDKLPEGYDWTKQDRAGKARRGR
jgi:hypothetical protein